MICVIDGCRRDEPGGEAESGPLLISVVAWCSTFAAVVTSDVGLLAYRELDDALGLSVLAGDRLAGCRAGKNGRHALVGLLRQSVFGRLADRTSTTPSGYVTILQCAGSSAVKLRKDALRHRARRVASKRSGLRRRQIFVAFVRSVVNFYNKRGTAEQWITEGKGAIKWTRLPCRTFAANAVRLQLHALAYNLGNFLRTLATSEAMKEWSLTSLREKLIKIGAKVVSHGRYVAFRWRRLLCRGTASRNCSD